MLDPRHLADRVAEASRVDEVDVVERTNRSAGRRRPGRSATCRPTARQHAQLGAGVVAVEVVGRIGFGEARGLRVGEDASSNEIRSASMRVSM